MNYMTLRNPRSSLGFSMNSFPSFKTNGTFMNVFISPNLRILFSIFFYNSMMTTSRSSITCSLHHLVTFSLVPRDHLIFHTDTNGIRPQRPPHFQLQVALKRFGTEGSSASSLSAISKHFGIGKGTVLLYTATCNYCIDE